MQFFNSNLDWITLAAFMVIGEKSYPHAKTHCSVQRILFSGSLLLLVQLRSPGGVSVVSLLHHRPQLPLAAEELLRSA